jgi:hypothetical protein
MKTNAEIIATSLRSRLAAEGMEIEQTQTVDKNGNVEVIMLARDLGLKIHMQETARPLAADFGLLDKDEGFVDHVDYSPPYAGELVLAADEEM